MDGPASRKNWLSKLLSIRLHERIKLSCEEPMFGTIPAQRTKPLSERCLSLASVARERARGCDTSILKPDELAGGKDINVFEVVPVLEL